MPTYCFKHPDLGHRTELFMSIEEMEARCNDDWIELDGEMYQRDYETELSGRPPGGCASWPMKSDAAGVHPSQVKEFTEQSYKMGVGTEFDSSTGQAVFTSRGHRARYLKAMGMHDRNGGYGD